MTKPTENESTPAVTGAVAHNSAVLLADEPVGVIHLDLIRPLAGSSRFTQAATQIGQVADGFDRAVEQFGVFSESHQAPQPLKVAEANPQAAQHESALSESPPQADAPSNALDHSVSKAVAGPSTTQDSSSPDRH